MNFYVLQSSHEIKKHSSKRGVPITNTLEKKVLQLLPRRHVNLFREYSLIVPSAFECSLSVAMFRASREHLWNILKENICVKMYNLTITNVDLLTD